MPPGMPAKLCQSIAHMPGEVFAEGLHVASGKRIPSHNCAWDLAAMLTETRANNAASLNFMLPPVSVPTAKNGCPGRVEAVGESTRPGSPRSCVRSQRRVVPMLRPPDETLGRLAARPG